METLLPPSGEEKNRSYQTNSLQLSVLTVWPRDRTSWFKYSEVLRLSFMYLFPVTEIQIQTALMLTFLWGTYLGTKLLIITVTINNITTVAVNNNINVTTTTILLIILLICCCCQLLFYNL